MKTGKLVDRRIVIIVMSALILTTLACGSASTPTATPLPKPTKAPTDEPAAAGPSLEIVNNSETPVCFVYVSPTKSDDWGTDQLGEENMINGGDSFTITDVPAGTYDVKAEDCSNNLLGVVYQADITEGAYTWTIETVTLTIKNESTSIGCNVFIALPNSDDWGTTWTPEGTQILPNDTYQVTGVPAGTYALRIETCSANYNWTWETFDLTDDAVATMTN